MRGTDVVVGKRGGCSLPMILEYFTGVILIMNDERDRCGGG